jgi:hypothetical protein
MIAECDSVVEKFFGGRGPSLQAGKQVTAGQPPFGTAKADPGEAHCFPRDLVPQNLANLLHMISLRRGSLKDIS